MDVKELLQKATQETNPPPPPPPPKRDVSRWCVALQGKTLIGLPVRDPEGRVFALDPAYELVGQAAFDKPGPDANPVSVTYRCWPISLIASWTSIPVLPGTILKPVSEFRRGEIDVLSAAVARCEQFIEGLSESASGVVWPPPGLLR